MAILTVARELGSIVNGEELTLCNALKLHCVDKSTIETRFREMGIEHSILERFDECGPGFTGMFSSGSTLYWEALRTVLLKELLNENVAIIGRGGNFLLKHLVDSFRIRLIAPLDFRINLLCKERSCSEDEAKKAIHHSDISREKFCRHYYGAEWRDPHNYDLTINTAELPLDKLAALLPPLMPQSATGKRNPLLLRAIQEQAIRHMLCTSEKFPLYSLEVKCPAPDIVILRGCAYSEAVVQQAVEAVKAFPGVKEVKNELSVVDIDLPVPMW